MEEGQTVEVTLSDVEWRQKSEELARAELTLVGQRTELEDEAAEWAERKKQLKATIEATEGKVRVLAREVDTRKALVPAQQTLPEPEEGGETKL
jgi:ABC-type Fe3+-hydroxamate transport system substrate-binding protein